MEGNFLASSLHCKRVWWPSHFKSMLCRIMQV
jgi:hypothetical protein